MEYGRGLDLWIDFVCIVLDSRSDTCYMCVRGAARVLDTCLRGSRHLSSRSSMLSSSFDYHLRQAICDELLRAPYVLVGVCPFS